MLGGPTESWGVGPGETAFLYRYFPTLLSLWYENPWGLPVDLPGASLFISYLFILKDP